MTKTQKLAAMKAAVEFKDRLPGGAEMWRTIAAFDSDRVAKSYVGKMENPDRYRVISFGGQI